jgi:hypothetical protein
MKPKLGETLAQSQGRDVTGPTTWKASGSDVNLAFEERAGGENHRSPEKDLTELGLNPNDAPIRDSDPLDAGLP